MVYELRNNEKGLPYLRETSCVYQSEDRCVKNSEDVCRLIRAIFDTDTLPEEHVWAIAFDTRNKPLGIFEVSHGTCKISVVSPREIMIRLLLCGAVSFIMVHNHPSGDPTPSREDDDMTKKIKKAGVMLDIPMLDHIVIGNGIHFSFKDENML